MFLSVENGFGSEEKVDLQQEEEIRVGSGSLINFSEMIVACKPSESRSTRRSLSELLARKFQTIGKR